MCYGMNCPHENSWGECTCGGTDCPLPGVAENFPVDMYEAECAPKALRSVYLWDPKWDEEMHVFYDRAEGVWDEGEEAEIEHDQADRAKVMAYWADETHEETTEWPARPAWVRDDPEDGEEG